MLRFIVTLKYLRHISLDKINQLAVLLVSISFATAGLANPVLNGVTSGGATVTQSGNTTTVNQTTDKAIIEWNSFNIAAGEKTQFVQPGAGSVALNRINPTQGASQIFGKLTSNGQIILVNAAGIHFGSGAMVNVGSMIASTADITNANFLAGKFIFNIASAYGGSIINEGNISAANYGLVALLGTSVINHGLIQAELGNIVLASGNKFTLDFNGDQLINFSIDEAANGAGVDANGKKVAMGVTSDGVVLADGGKILVSAQQAEGVLDNVINMAGVAQAQSVNEQNGEIILDGGSNGSVLVAGVLNAAGTTAGATGGTVKVLSGNDVHLASSATINTNGSAGGGTVLVGGNSQGQGPEVNALTTEVDAGSHIYANALDNGAGGKVVVWSNNNTSFNGAISAQGGALGGSGGSAETSGESLNINGGTVNLLAAHGAAGTWLLDPGNVTISTGATSGNSGFQPGNGSSTTTINIYDLLAALASANVVVSTTNSSGNGGASGNITVSTAITWDTATALTLSAANTITISSAITALNGTLSLSAANSSQSITDSAAVNVANFLLTSGQWYQNNSTLPAFSATNNFALSNGTAFTRVAGGAGTNASQYKIVDIYGLQGLAYLPSTTSVTLPYDIDASVTKNWNNGAGFVPIGQTNAFNTNFSGSNTAIFNLYINLPGTSNVGLFANTGSSASISNVGLVNAIVTGSSEVGALVGSNYGNLNTTYATGVVNANTGTDFAAVGGLVGVNYNTVQFSYANVTVTGGGYAGGLVGVNQDTSGVNSSIDNSYALGNVSSTSAIAGGIVGANGGGNGGHASTTNSYSTGAVSASGGSAGGAIGSDYGGGTVTNVYWDEVTSGLTTSGGGTGITTESAATTLATYSGFGISSSNGSNNWFIVPGQTRPILSSELNAYAGTTINTAHQLELLQNWTGNSFTLAPTIDASGTSVARDVWVGQGFYNVSSAFTGTLNGLTTSINGIASTSTINNLKLSANSVGLLSSTSTAATVENIGLVNASLVNTTSSSFSGLLIGTNNGTLYNDYSTGSIQGYYTGGLVGQDSGGTGTNLYSTASVKGSQDSGGLFSQMTGSSTVLLDSFAAGAVSNNNSSGYSYGGLIGFVSSGPVAKNVFESGSLSVGNSGNSVGGVVGNYSGNFTDVYASGFITSSSTYGALIGSMGNNATMTNAYANSSTNGGKTSLYGSTGSGETFTNNTALTTAQFQSSSNLVGFGFYDSTVSLASNISNNNVWIMAGGPHLETENVSTITNVAQLQLMEVNLAGQYTLANNIDATGTSSWNSNAGFVPVGNSTINFTGTFNGNGYVINGLTENYPSSPYIGLFGVATGGTGSVGGLSVLQNVGLTNVNITGTSGVGALVGYSNGSNINNVYVTGNITGNTFVSFNGVGGIAGNLTGVLNDSYTNIYLTHTGDAGNLAGDLNSAVITNSFSIGTLTGAGGSYGGLIGFVNNSGAIIDSFTQVDSINGTSGNNGALIGAQSGGGAAYVSNSYFDSSTTSATSTTFGTAETTSQLQAGLLTGFSSSVWSIMAGNSYPYLNQLFTSTPLVISGNASGVAENVQVVLADNGSNVNSTYTGANGYFYFLLANNTLAGNSMALTYLNSGANPGNVVTIVPSSGSGSINETLTANALTIGDKNTNTISNSNLVTARGSLTSNIEYSNSGSSISTGYNFITTGTTTYNINSGTLTLNGAGSLSGSLTGSGGLTLSPSSNTIVSVGSSSTNNGNYTGAITLTTGGAQLSITSDAYANPLGTGTINMSSGQITATTAIVTNPITNNLTLTANETIGGGSSMTFTGQVSVSGGSLFTREGSSAVLTLSGLVTGSGGVDQGDSPYGGTAGTLILSNANNYSGGTTISAGILGISTSTSLGSGNVSLNGGTLQAENAFSMSNAIAVGSSGGVLDPNGNWSGGGLVLTGIISGTSSTPLLTINDSTTTGQGIVELDGANTFTGGLKIISGTLGVSSDTQPFSGTLVIAGSGNAGIRADNASHTFSNAITANSSFNIGRQTTLSGAITLGTNITIYSNNPDGAANGNSTISGAIGDGGHGYSLAYANGTNGIGTGYFVISGSNTYTGDTNISTNVQANSTGNAFGTGTLTLNGGTLQAGNTTAISNAVSVSNNSTISGTNGISFGSSLGISDGDTLTLSTTGTTSFSGTATLSGSGTLKMTNSADSVGLLAGTNTTSSVTLGSGTLTINSSGNGAAGTYKGVISGTGGITVNLSGTTSPTETFTGSNTYTGGTTISGGNLTITNLSGLGTGTVGITSSTLNINVAGTFADAITFNGSGTLVAGAAVTLSKTMTINNSLDDINTQGNALILSGSLAGSGATYVDGSGSGYFQSTATNTGFSGTFVVRSGGTLADGTVNNNTFGSGTINLGGGTYQNYTNESSATLTITANNSTANLGNSGATTWATLNLSSGLSGVVLNMPGSHNATFNNITGSGNFTLSGSGGGGILGFYNTGSNNTYSGTATITNGTLQLLSATNAFGSTSTINLNGGTLNVLSSLSSASIGSNVTVTAASSISGSQLTINGATSVGSTLNITDSQNVQFGVLHGSSTINGGTTSGSAGTITLAGGTGSDFTGILVANGAEIINFSAVNGLGTGQLTLNNTSQMNLNTSGTYGISLYLNNTTSSKNIYAPNGVNAKISGNIDVVGTTSLYPDNGANIYTLGALTGSGTINFNGPYTWYMQGDSSSTITSGAFTNGTAFAGTINASAAGTLETDISNALGGSTATLNVTSAPVNFEGYNEKSSIIFNNSNANVITFNGTNTSSTLSGDITLTSTLYTAISSGSSVLFSGLVHGAGGINVAGSGTLSLGSGSTANTFTGGVTLTSGALNANSTSSPFGTGALNLNGGTLESGVNTSLGNSSYIVGTGDTGTIGGTGNITFNKPIQLGTASSGYDTTYLSISNYGTTTLDGLSSLANNPASTGNAFYAVSINTNNGAVIFSGDATNNYNNFLGNMNIYYTNVSLANTATNQKLMGAGSLELGATNISATSAIGSGSSITNSLIGSDGDVGIGGSNAISFTGGGQLNYTWYIGDTGGVSLTGNTALDNIFTVQTGGALTLSGSNTGTSSNYGVSVASGGLLVLGSANALGAADANASGVSTNSLGNVTVSSGGEVDIGAFAISSPVTWSLAGTGLTANSGRGALYATNTTGTASITGVVSLSASTTIGVASGGTLTLNSGTGTGVNLNSNSYTLTTNTAGSGSTININSVLNGLSSNSTAGALTASGSGNTAINSANSSTYNGAVSVTGGTLTAGNATSPFGAGTLSFNGTTVALNASTATTLGNSSITLTGGDTLNIPNNSKDITFSNSFATGNTSSVLNLAGGNNVYFTGLTGSGAMNVSAGSAYFGGTSATSNSTYNGTIGLGYAYLVANNSFVDPFGIGSINIDAGATSNFEGYISSNVTNASAIVNNITLANTTAARYTTSGLNVAGSNPLTFSGTISMGGNGIYDSNSSGTTFNGVISGTGVVSGSGGTLTLGASNTYTGATSLSSGTLVLNTANGLGSSTGHYSSAININGSSALDLNFSGTLANPNTITLNSSAGSTTGALYVGGSNVTLTNPISLTASTTIGNPNAGGLLFSGDTITSTGSTNLTFNFTAQGVGIALPNINLTSGGATLDVYTNGGTITQNSGTSIQLATSSTLVANTNVSSNSSSAAITLNNSGNIMNSDALGIVSGGANASVTETGSLTLGTTNVGTGTYTLNATGAIGEYANTTFTAGTLSLSAGSNAINFNGTGSTNSIGTVNLSNSGSNAINFFASGATSLGTLTLNSGTQAISLASGGAGDFTFTQAITLNSGNALTVNSAKSINLNSSTGITVNSGSSASLTATNNIYLNSGISGTGQLTLSAASGLGSITSGTSAAPNAGGVNQTINVGTFILAKGGFQENATTLPTFAATNFEITGGANAQFLRVTGGSGSTGSPYQITDVYGLQGASTLATNSYKLMNNIDASGTSSWSYGSNDLGFQPIYSFTGSFNGNGQTISSVYIYQPLSGPLGFFGSVNSGGSVSTLGLVNPNISSYTTVGGLVGSLASGATLTSDYVSGGNIIGLNNGTGLGGLVGSNSGTIISSWSSAGVVGSSGNSVGGLVGVNTSTGVIQNSYSTGAVNAGSSNQVGGFVGSNSGSITGSYSTGSVSGYTSVGGFIGANSSSSQAISGNYSTSTVSASGDAGGFVGYVGSGTLTSNYALGNVASGLLNAAYSVGGFVGYNGGTITNSYSMGNPSITNAANNVGGFIGYNGGTINTSISYGAPSDPNGASHFGGFAGGLASTAFTNDYFDYSKAGTTYAAQSGAQSGINAESDLQMQSQSTFSGFTFYDTTQSYASNSSAYWMMAGYPHLVTENTQNITTLVQLQLAAANPTQSYTLANSIDAAATASWNGGLGFNPIGYGTYESGVTAPNYTGTFNGQNFIISNLFIDRPNTTDVGLFGSVGSAGSIINLGVTGSVQGAARTALLVGQSAGALNNDWANGTVVAGAGTGNYDVGILVGRSDSSIQNSYSMGSLIDLGTAGSTGGLAGSSFGSISNSYNAASVYAPNITNSSVGGVVGDDVNSNLTNVYNIGTITGSYETGGLTGSMASGGTITGSYNSGIVTGTGIVGALVGLLSSGSFNSTQKSYYDTTIANGVAGIGSGSSANALGLTTAQSILQSSYTNWSFGNSSATTWYINNGRPILQMEYSTNISNAHQLELIGESATSLAATYTQVANVDLSGSTNAADVFATSLTNGGVGFIPIGTLNVSSANNGTTGAFTGNYNGQGYTIDSLYENQPTTLNTMGLFGDVTQATGGYLKNISLTNVNINGGPATGGLVGNIGNASQGSISSVYVTGSIAGHLNGGSYSGVGGIVGVDFGSSNPISYAYDLASVSGNDGFSVGGIAGFSPSNISYSYVTGAITGTSRGAISGSQTNFTNDIYDTVTTGLGGSSSAGITAGCYGCGTNNLALLSTYQSAGWGSSVITSTPGTTAPPSAAYFILNGYSRPILTSEYKTSITNADQLELINAAPNATYSLGANFDGSGSSAIFNGNGLVSIATFGGTLNGAGHIINNLVLQNIVTNDFGLFDYNTGTIANVGLTNVNINFTAPTTTSGTDAGILVGDNLAGSVLAQDFVTGSIAQTSNQTTTRTGGLAGINYGTIVNSYSQANVSGTATCNGAQIVTGGLVASNFPGGTIANSYSTGAVTSTANSPSLNYTGAFLGENQGTATNDYYSSTLSGQSTAISYSPGTTTNLQNETYAGLTNTSNMSSLGLTTGGYWNMTNSSMAYLSVFYLAPVRVITGTTGAATNGTVTLVANGAVVDTTRTLGDSSHTFYLMEGFNKVADNSSILTYLTNTTISGNDVTTAPTGGASISGISLVTNTVTVGDAATKALSTTNLITALGSLSNAGILYSAGSGNLTLSAASLATTATTPFTFNGNITSSGSQNYGNTVSLAVDTVLNAGAGAITFSNTVNSASATTHALTLNSTGVTTLSGAVGNLFALTSLTTNAGGSTAINGGSVTTSGSAGQVYNDAVTIGANTTLTTGAGALSLNSTVNDSNTAGTDSLNLSAATGAITLGGAVGGSAALSGLSAIGGSTISALSVKTTGAQSYSGTTTLNGTYLTAASTFGVTGALTLNGATSIDTTNAGNNSAGNNISFSSTVNGAQTLSATSGTAGTITFTGAVGTTTALTSLTTSGLSTTFTGAVGSTSQRLGSVSITGATNINGGSIYTSGTQGYAGAVLLGADTNLTTTNSNVSFNSTVNGAHALTVAAGTGAVGFSGTVGNSHRINQLIQHRWRHGYIQQRSGYQLTTFR